MKTKQMPIEVREWLNQIMKIGAACLVVWFATFVLVMTWWWAILVQYVGWRPLPTETGVAIAATLIILVGAFLGLREMKK